MNMYLHKLSSVKLVVLSPLLNLFLYFVVVVVFCVRFRGNPLTKKREERRKKKSLESQEFSFKHDKKQEKYQHNLN